MKMLLVSLLECLTFLNFGFASPLARRKRVYYIDCTRTGQAALQDFCTSPPYSYMCVPGSGVLMVARGSTVCDRNCDCILAPPPRPDGECYLTPFIITPLCGIKHEDAMALNMTLVSRTIDQTGKTSDIGINHDETKVNIPSNQIAPESEVAAISLSKRRATYYVECKGPFSQQYCTSGPSLYTCRPGDAGLVGQRVSTYCNENCKCVLAVAPPDPKECFQSFFSPLPLCGISHDEAMAKNMTLITATTEREAAAFDSLLTPANEDNTSISTRSDLQKRHDYALDCTKEGSSFQKYCTQSPRRYSCTEAGRVTFSQSDTICNNDCVCRSVGPPCYISPWSVLPLCGISKEEAEAGNMTKISATSVHQGTARSLGPTSTVDNDAPQAHDRTPSANQGITDISSDFGLEKRHDYGLDCTRGDDGSWQAYCIQTPRRYYCSTAGRVSYQVYDQICKQNCACINTGPPKPCYVSPWSVLPLCGISKDEAEARNLTLASTPVKALARSVDSTGSTNNIAASTEDLGPSVNAHDAGLSVASDLEKRHDYALDCRDTGDSSWQSYCTSSPRKYFCDSCGKVQSQKSSSACSSACRCVDIGASNACYVAFWSVLPLCGISKEEAEAQNLTRVDPSLSSPINTTSTSPGHFDNNSPVRREAQTSGSVELEKRHNYALDCTGSGNKVWQLWCTKSPRKYYCNSVGQLKSQKDSATCNLECVCVDIGSSNPCYISPWSVLPLCGISSEEAEANNMTLVSTTPAAPFNTTSTSLGPVSNNSPVERHAQRFGQDESADVEAEEELREE